MAPYHILIVTISLHDKQCQEIEPMNNEHWTETNRTIEIAEIA